MVVPLQLGFMDFDQIYAKKRTGSPALLGFDGDHGSMEGGSGLE